MVMNSAYDESEAVVTVRIDPADLERIKRLPGKMRVEKTRAK